MGLKLGPCERGTEVLWSVTGNVNLLIAYLKMLLVSESIQHLLSSFNYLPSKRIKSFKYA